MLGALSRHARQWGSDRGLSCSPAAFLLSAVYGPQGTLVAERPSPSGKPETAAVAEGSLVSCVAYLSSTRTSIAVRAAEVCLRHKLDKTKWVQLRNRTLTPMSILAAMLVMLP